MALARASMALRPAARHVRMASTLKEFEAAAIKEHNEWLAAVKNYKTVTPDFASTLEWALPTPVPLHQFTESPVVIEVLHRNKDYDKDATH